MRIGAQRGLKGPALTPQFVSARPQVKPKVESDDNDNKLTSALAAEHNYALEDIVSKERPQEIFRDIEGTSHREWGGFTYHGINLRTDQKVTIFVIPIEKRDLKPLILEIPRMWHKHPNLINYIDSFIVHENGNGEFWIVTECLNAENLSQTIVNKFADFQLNEAHIACVCGDVLRGLLFLHDLGLVHGEIKAENIYLSSEGDVKIHDFHSLYKCLKYRIMSPMPAKFCWTAPEMTGRSKLFTNKVDIWCLGITIREMAEGHAPDHSGLEVSMQPRPHEPQKWSDEFQSFAIQCLIPKPDDRPDARALLQHSFIKKACTNAELGHAIHEALTVTSYAQMP